MPRGLDAQALASRAIPLPSINAAVVYTTPGTPPFAMREADTPVLIKAFAKPPQDQGKGLGLKASIMNSWRNRLVTCSGLAEKLSEHRHPGCASFVLG